MALSLAETSKRDVQKRRGAFFEKRVRGVPRAVYPSMYTLHVHPRTPPHCDYRTGVPECAGSVIRAPRAVELGGFRDHFIQGFTVGSGSSLHGSCGITTSVWQAKRKNVNKTGEVLWQAKKAPTADKELIRS